jgi:hypothetical protein
LIRDVRAQGDQIRDENGTGGRRHRYRDCLLPLPHSRNLLEPRQLEGKVPAGTRRLLVKSRNGRRLPDPVFHTDYVAFSPESASGLLSRGVRLLGFDYLSIAPYPSQPPTHAAFLGAGGAVIENVDLSRVAPGEYQLWCLPLRIQRSGGAPARAILGAPDSRLSAAYPPNRCLTSLTMSGPTTSRYWMKYRMGRRRGLRSALRASRPECQRAAKADRTATH